MKLSTLISRKSPPSSGNSAELFARNYLEQQGLVWQAQNFYNRAGEIDLIMKDGKTLVFVEVKYRKNASYGGPLAAVSSAKQQKIKQCATFFLQQEKLNAYNTDCRFDVVGLLGDLQSPEVTWLKNAF